LYIDRCPLAQAIAIKTIKMKYLDQTNKKRMGKYEVRNKLPNEKTP
jgi:hypothetical protein